MTNENREFLQRLYDAFNRREFEKVIALMHPNVKWANGMEGGFVDGREAVREYWRRQFEVTRSRLEPLEFETDENGRNVVTVALVVTDLNGKTLAEKTVRQIFTIRDGLIVLFEIEGAEPLRLIDAVREN
ncbi:MAG TPA: nuclear transport factor 2 family protein [Pyrinomonadaceae bacterium]|jgi:ketosteroid isomerase-like protein